MIYTVTFNPALDYIIRMNTKLEPGMTNRSDSEDIFYGGKGINVSRVLKSLGVESTALGFIAGFTGKEIASHLQEMGIRTDFVELDHGMSRINVKLKSDLETEVNAQGPDIDKKALVKLFSQIDVMIEGDVLILAGSIPKSMPDDVYEQIMTRIDGKGVLAAVDATGDLLVNVLPFHPFLIKPNNFELGEIVGRELKTDEEIADAARELQKKGARNVLISMAGDGSLLVDETGNVTRLAAFKGQVKNSVGAGDSMVAGFMAGWLKTHDYQKALRLGSAAGSATAFSDDLATGEDIMKLYEQ